MSVPVSEPQTTQDQRPAWRSIATSLLLDVALPFAAYHVLKGRGLSTVAALSLSGVFPAGGVVLRFIRGRTVDGFGVLVLAAIALGVVTSLISGNARFVLVKESFFTGAFGVVMLGSLLARRPLMFYFGRRFRAGDDPEARRHWNDLWQYESFRRANRVMTLVWGVAFVVEAAVRVFMAYTLPVSVVQAVGSVMAFTVVAALIVGTTAYGRRVRRRATADAQPTAA